ncbi:type II toxin-antitoxin system VapC family toxin [Salinarimonas rosea]|uniref:type II toxin-antitoxin system VapC family toxin n=1 Tax=Salinarimonas rosea TaxID=552063 RepID=UPI00069428EA|nr:type II toxin-antitoxin system VapC family toxin [Salinarimonas rosea]
MNVERAVVYLDANVFIMAVETRGADEQAVARLFASEAAAGLRRLTSELTLAEVLAGASRASDRRLVRAYLSLILESGLVEVQPVSRAILIETAHYRAVADQGAAPGADRRNFLPDAVHVVTAITNGCAVFVTNDRRLKLPQGMRRIEPTAEGIGDLLDRS